MATTPDVVADQPLRTSPEPEARTGVCPFQIPMKQDEVNSRALQDQFDVMRDEGSVAWAQLPYGTVNNGQGWVATGFKEVKAVLMDNRFSVARKAHGDYPRARALEIGAPFPDSFIVMDPPAQSERRRTLMKHLTPKRVNGLRPFTERLVEDCLDEMERQGPGVDMLPEFVYKVPLFLLCELLGAPPEERHIYVKHAHDFVATRHATAADASKALETIKTYFKELCCRKREKPGDDLISALLLDTEVNGLWSQEELEGVGTVLLMAGHDSTASFISNCLYWLVHNPETFTRLREEPDLILKAVDEFLRFLPVGVAPPRARVAIEDVQFGDTLIRKDESVLPIPHAGNLDPKVYACPRQFDLDREKPAQHLAFGFGAHFCVGSQLARMDIEVILRGVTQRFTSLSPMEFDPDWEAKGRTRGPKTLCVQWTK
ncbi:cytochrome P450 [Sphingomonadaceae bacterium jetA1]|uniref:cytochrome P450 n=1 Tax=Facivitalis istanbulensis TaxID=3075838 RepID=UPI00348D410B